MASTTGTVTMADVGERAGVTGRTVSNVLSGHPSVRPETRDRVLRAVDELGYRLNTSARSLRTGRTGSITLAIPELGIDYFTDLAGRIMIEAERHGWSVVIQQTGARRDNELAILSGASRQHSDGLIFQPHALGPGRRAAPDGQRPARDPRRPDLPGAGRPRRDGQHRGRPAGHRIPRGPRLPTHRGDRLEPSRRHHQRCVAAARRVPRGARRPRPTRPGRVRRRRRGLAPARRSRRHGPAAEPVRAPGRRLLLQRHHGVRSAARARRPRADRSRRRRRHRVRQRARWPSSASPRSRPSNPERTRSPSTPSTCWRHASRGAPDGPTEIFTSCSLVVRRSA